MKLIIVESPTKAKTLSKFLGSDFVVKSSFGHIRDLPKSNKDAVDIAGGFVPRYQILKEKQKVIAELREAAEKADEVILSPDPDREGEAIAWHLAQVIGLKNPKRSVFHEITQRAVAEALAHPREIDNQLVRAQEARRVLDRLFGYDLSGLIWKKVRYGLSAGRVQSPALRILMEREREIRAFVPEKFWVISANLKTKSGGAFTATCVEEPKTEPEAKKILTAAQTGTWFVKDIEESEQSRAARPPFTTSTLQQTASTRLGFSPSRTMRIAQKLYEAGHITYMRTDSVHLAQEAQANFIAVIKKEFGENYAEPREYKTKSKSAQEAHEAIRPTDAAVRACGANEEEKKLYVLIRARALASQMSDARIARTKIIANISNSSLPDFAVNGSRVVFEGWLKADPSARGEDVELPKTAKNDPLTLMEAAFEGKETQPPGRYSEAGLVKELEKRDIGRPSTYASIIKTLEDRGYVEKQNRTLMPTATGDVVSSFIEENFGDYISDTFTAEMENELDEIAEGKRTYEGTLTEFYEPFHKAVKGKSGVAKITEMGAAPKEFPCPICGKAMVYKLSRTGRFMSCVDFPKCLGARKEDGSVIAPPKEIGETCPECSRLPAGRQGQLIEREGRFGRFIACSNYPKCKFIKKGEAEEAKGKTGVQCPICKKGEMVERRGKFGVFYSCSNYPDCKNAIKARPTGRLCNLCGALYMLGTKTIPERCSNKDCPNHNPHKLKAN
ncbi:DNA topoisomerase I [Candidatus Uhrbacteria bacterium RIFCSPLOWO2_01_FULL_47_24]|uniref:DNA topoisomerase 1 n=1 Tax=Candidatus Uhrbacteria bacterium RIFCSPLOWO2_01_FULL_47_24 TaxID=1802401 RepID=A0A1F7UR39_9BACT|nr:MAG: DNA topoisomerase I [Candidatus Uhrbacteria bacterium RIFCSPHIGHO2_01_FULL_47_11]OGL68102.1 MAG: DNA topoisomerase I [Candidatus Uhrbacteria bacterium RIFCSPHIGHO2_02_FULL_46_47]OGL80194.1 MAG: DNA topoisomerase I [Candidatus Uhrbacteria bacterium RIFCSPLOWO2_01_FULL_47_24]OGL84980.1 MAG: DNA topoisomerase I [Candidatus Uhrbacteria bacterium RIFCSPLOWO2_02_FULL_46_25]OGL92692.1 MAG: DNA topoisomerase I [Candidatus Uhrbacteria bacterium RIFCSPLOWO2_12_FULL_47_10]